MSQRPEYDLVRCFDASDAMIYVVLVKSGSRRFLGEKRYARKFARVDRVFAARGYRAAVKFKLRVIAERRPILNLQEREHWRVFNAGDRPVTECRFNEGVYRLEPPVVVPRLMSQADVVRRCRQAVKDGRSKAIKV